MLVSGEAAKVSCMGAALDPVTSIVEYSSFGNAIVFL